MNAFAYLMLMAMMAATTFLTRGFFFMLARSRMPAWLQHALGYVPAVALAAIVAPDLLVSGGSVSLSWTNIKLIAGVAAIAFFLRTRHVLATLVSGMVVFTALRLAM
ncbi:MAG: AzlD domain-containing protein [Oxalobacteraceae bacterium]